MQSEKRFSSLNPVHPVQIPCSTTLHLPSSVSICVNLWPSLGCLSIREIREIRGHSPALSAGKQGRLGGQFLPGFQAKALSNTASLVIYLHFV